MAGISGTCHGCVSQELICCCFMGHKDGNVILVSDEITSAEDLQERPFAIPSNQLLHNILLNDMLAGTDITVDDLPVLVHHLRCHHPRQRCY